MNIPPGVPGLYPNFFPESAWWTPVCSHLLMPDPGARFAVQPGPIHHDSLSPAEPQAAGENLADLTRPATFTWLFG